MIHRFQSCPGVDALKVFLDLELFNFDSSKEISFKQSKTNDKAKLIGQSSKLPLGQK